MSSSFLLIPLAQFQWQTVKGTLICLEEYFEEGPFTDLCWLPTWAVEVWFGLEELDSTPELVVDDFE